MSFISKKQALCIFFCEKYTEAAAETLTLRLSSIIGCDICYGDDPQIPMLQTVSRIISMPHLFHEYHDNSPELVRSPDRVNFKIYGELKDYMNQVYTVETPSDGKLYESKEMTMKDIYLEVVHLTDLFDDKSIRSFSTWCGKVKLDCLRSEPSRNNAQGTERARSRFLWVLRNEHRAKATVNVRRCHKAQIEGLKCNNFDVIGYVRKSPGKERTSARLSLLASMIERLKEDSSVIKVFGSYSSTSNQRFADRDFVDPVHVPNTLGNTQDLLRHLSTSNKPVAIVAIDFAGLTTNVNDLVKLLRDYETIKMVLIENIQAHNKTYCFTREQLLKDETVLQQFNCRPELIRRSLRS
ncbi:hypothetical protein INT44_008678 [Umbelopsis vinacea]|uniref:Uncharacterized protein n=1 Tax=Umbelopsis vinacea TaxID=44442 RepID=A0A8H7PX18_9FUNG|nr:hypothetical protein INT44_008678 [Umbelopsis vinacea]